jgi:hypothetical protein
LGQIFRVAPCIDSLPGETGSKRIGSNLSKWRSPVFIESQLGKDGFGLRRIKAPLYNAAENRDLLTRQRS